MGWDWAVVQTDGAFRTIGEALRAASPGMVVHIRAGTYHERVVVPPMVELVGDGSDVVRICGPPSIALEVCTPKLFKALP
eukprot:6024302-Pyramimonas_sp.AAC.1